MSEFYEPGKLSDYPDEFEQRIDNFVEEALLILYPLLNQTPIQFSMNGIPEIMARILHGCLGNDAEHIRHCSDLIIKNFNIWIEHRIKCFEKEDL